MGASKTERMSIKMTTPKKMVARQATADDYEAVMDIDRDVFDGHDYLLAMYHAYMQDSTRYCYLVEIDGRVVSYATWYCKYVFKSGEFGKSINF